MVKKVELGYGEVRYKIWFYDQVQTCGTCGGPSAEQEQVQFCRPTRSSVLETGGLNKKVPPLAHLFECLVTREQDYLKGLEGLRGVTLLALRLQRPIYPSHTQILLLLLFYFLTVFLLHMSSEIFKSYSFHWAFTIAIPKVVFLYIVPWITSLLLLGLSSDATSSRDFLN